MNNVNNKGKQKSKSGGGGGHSLNVKDMTAHLVIFDISDKRIAKNFEALGQEGALKDGTPFHFNVLKATTQALRTQVESDIALDVHLVQLFKSIGISIDIVSLGALIEICDAFLGNSSELISHHLSRNPTSDHELNQRFVAMVFISVIACLNFSPTISTG